METYWNENITDELNKAMEWDLLILMTRILQLENLPI